MVPLDKDLPLDELVGILNYAECEYLVYSASIEEKIMQIGDSVPTLKHISARASPERIRP